MIIAGSLKQFHKNSNMLMNLLGFFYSLGFNIEEHSSGETVQDCSGSLIVHKGRHINALK